MSEHRSKQLLAGFGLEIAPEELVGSPSEAAQAAARLGYPVVLKLCGDAIAHKTERGLVRLGLTSRSDVEAAVEELLAAAEPEDGEVELLVAKMVSGARELIIGLATDPTFGPVVMVGIGGIAAEAVADTCFALVPLTKVDAAEMVASLELQSMFGEFRGEPEVDQEAVADAIVAVARCAEENAEIASIDLNPLVIVDGKPVAVDALVVTK